MMAVVNFLSSLTSPPNVIYGFGKPPNDYYTPCIFEFSLVHSQHGPLAIATAVVDSGIRLYTKFSDGTVITESISNTQQEVEAAQQNDNKGRFDVAILQVY